MTWTDAKIQRQIAHFDAIAGTYHDARQHPNHLLLKELIWACALSRSEALGGLCRDRNGTIEVLEPMCGFADGKAILEAHAPAVADYHGFDFSERVIAILRNDMPDADIWQQDVTRFVPQPGSYDVVILLGGLHHVPDAAAAVVGRLAAALRPNGLFINFEPTSGNPVFGSIRRRIYQRNALFDEVTERDFPVAELMRMFTDAGLRLVDVLYPGLLAYVLYYNPDAFPLLNRGGTGLVKAAYTIDRLFQRTPVGRALSFATLSIWQQSGDPVSQP